MLIAIGWNNFASTPSKLNNGANTTKIIEAAKKTGRATSLPAFCRRNLMPCSSCSTSCGSASEVGTRSFTDFECVASGLFKCLNIFSTITTEPSTSIPIATAMPPSDIRFAEMPHQAIIINAIPIEIGIDINTKKVARKFIKNSANTIQMKINASNSASTTVFTAFSIKSA